MPVFCVCPHYQNLAPKGRFFFGKDALWGMFGAFIPVPRLASPGERSSEAVGYGGRGARDGSLRKEEAWGPQPVLLPGKPEPVACPFQCGRVRARSPRVLTWPSSPLRSQKPELSWGRELAPW